MISTEWQTRPPVVALKGKWKVPTQPDIFGDFSIHTIESLSWDIAIFTMSQPVIQKCSQGINQHSQRKNPYRTSPFCCPLKWVLNILPIFDIFQQC